MIDNMPMQAAIDAMSDDDGVRFANDAAALTAELRGDAGRRPLWREVAAEAARRRDGADPTATAWQAWADAAMDARAS